MSSWFDEVKFLGGKIAHLGKELAVGRKSTAMSMAKVLMLTAPGTAVIETMAPKDVTPKRDQKTFTRIVAPERTIVEMLADVGLTTTMSKLSISSSDMPNGNLVTGVPKGPKQLS